MKNKQLKEHEREVAAKNLNRNFIGIEMDDKYFEIASDRIFKTQKGLT